MKKRRRKQEGLCPISAANFRLTLPPCWSLANTTYFSLVENHSGIPDVASGSNQRVFLEDNCEADDLFASFFKAENAEAGAPSEGGKKFLRFVHQLTDNHRLEWETALWKKRLYVQVPSDLAKQGSRDSLVALLDAAEEVLGCAQVVIGMPRDIADRAQLIRTFKFLGFELVPFGHPNLPSSADYLFMVYDI